MLCCQICFSSPFLSRDGKVQYPRAPRLKKNNNRMLNAFFLRAVLQVELYCTLKKMPVLLKKDANDKVGSRLFYTALFITVQEKGAPVKEKRKNSPCVLTAWPTTCRTLCKPS